MFRTGLRLWAAPQTLASSSIAVRTPNFSFVRGMATKRTTFPSKPHSSAINPEVTVLRELPDPIAQKRKQRVYFAIFCAVMGLSVFGMIKYEAANSPIVTSTLYTLRRSEMAREYLGDNITFKSTMPWITGSPGYARNFIEFSYEAKGSKAAATVHFAATKVPQEERFQTLAWDIRPAGASAPISLIDDDFHPFVPGPKDEPGMQRNVRA